MNAQEAREIALHKSQKRFNAEMLMVTTRIREAANKGELYVMVGSISKETAIRLRELGYGVSDEMTARQYDDDYPMYVVSW